MPFTILYTTHPDKDTARKIAKKLLEKKLIACANFFQSSNYYTWEEILREDKETIALFKLPTQNVEKAEKTILALHPYDTPCIITLPVTANKAYEDWLAGCTKP
ncbi:divalent-cation tolerance protein CutA [Candidatus Woesearchaeota archaeon]|nr:divalent-cation tolerance protein CutA [Candidatus Woesearchaeota archaeon]